MPSNKKNEQLGMGHGKAAHILGKDILWSLITETGKTVCCRCGKEMCRQTFSIEHLVPWLDSDNPTGLFFDLNNISFSHLKCNVAAARKRKAPCGTSGKYARGCRCDLCRSVSAASKRKNYCPEKRRQKKLLTGH